MSWDGFNRYARELRSGLLNRPRRDPQDRDPTVPFFWTLLVCHAAFWAIFPALMQPNVSDETLQLLESGRTFAWGYAEHPPLGAWIAAALTSLTAPSIWPLYVCSQLCGIVSVWAVWNLARGFLHPWTALCAAMVLLTGFTFTLASGTFTGAHLATMLWSLAILAFHEALVNPRRRYWVATGAALGLGFLCSYGTAVLLLAMGCFMVFDRRARRCWDSSWWMLSLLALGLVVVNHIWWLMAHDLVTLAEAFQASGSGQGSALRRFDFLGSQAIGFVAILIVLYPVVRRFHLTESIESEEGDNEFTRIYLTWMVALPAAVILILSVVADPRSAAVSGVCLWSYLGVLVLMWSQLHERRTAWRRVLLRAGTAAGFLAALFVATQVMLPHLTKQASTTLYPGQTLTQAVADAWKNAGGRDAIPVLAGPPEMLRNVSWYADPQSRPAVIASSIRNPQEDAAIAPEWEQSLVKSGGIMLWPSEGDNLPTINQLRSRLANMPVEVNVLSPLSLSWHTTADVAPVQVAMAVVRPSMGHRFQVADQSPASPRSPAGGVQRLSGSGQYPDGELNRVQHADGDRLSIPNSPGSNLFTPQVNSTLPPGANSRSAGNPFDQLPLNDNWQQPAVNPIGNGGVSLGNPTSQPPRNPGLPEARLNDGGSTIPNLQRNGNPDPLPNANPNQGIRIGEPAPGGARPGLFDTPPRDPSQYPSTIPVRPEADVRPPAGDNWSGANRPVGNPPAAGGSTIPRLENPPLNQQNPPLNQPPVADNAFAPPFPDSTWPRSAANPPTNAPAAPNLNGDPFSGLPLLDGPPNSTIPRQ